MILLFEIFFVFLYIDESQKEKIWSDEIFLNFAQNHPEASKGLYLSANTNLLLAYAEYINNSDIQAVAAEIGYKISRKESKLLFKMMDDGIEKYLLDNIKIIALT